MESINNNQFEIKPTNNKRKIRTPCPNVYLNPALDILANDDPICNTAMEIVPNKKKKPLKNCDIAAFENSALDIGISKSAVNEFLVRELNNVYKNVKLDNTAEKQIMNTRCTTTGSRALHSNTLESLKQHINTEEPIYANVINTSDCNGNTTEDRDGSITTTEISDPVNVSNIDNVGELQSNTAVLVEEPSPCDIDISSITHVEADVSNQVIIDNRSNLSLSFMDRLELDSPNTSNQSLYFDDDLNESNIMEIKTITIITKKKRVHYKNNNPFLDPNVKANPTLTYNPFLNESNEVEYSEQALTAAGGAPALPLDGIVPRKLFTYDTNSTISSVNESSIDIASQNEYENVDSYRSESPEYENIIEPDEVAYNKQSKVLGCDVTRFSAADIMDLHRADDKSDSWNGSRGTGNALKRQLLKVGNKLSKKVFRTIKKTFKTDKCGKDAALNPYEVPRKPNKHKAPPNSAGIENPALSLNGSDDIAMEEILDDESEYEALETARDTRLNATAAPLSGQRTEHGERCSVTRPCTPGKRVRFDATLNREKVITGDSFESDAPDPGPARRTAGIQRDIEEYHDELENCINERKYLQQNIM